MRQNQAKVSFKLFNNLKILISIVTTNIAVACIYLMPILGSTQNVIKQSSKKIKAEKFTTNNGLAANSIGQGFADPQGRLWFNPEQEQAQNLRMSFFQFDGDHSLFYDLKPDWLSDNDLTPVWYIIGVTPDGALFGADISNKTLFLWHPDSRKQFFYRLSEDSLLLNMNTEPDGGILALTAEIPNKENPTIGSYQILRPFEKGKKEIATIQLDFKDDLLPHRPSKKSYSFAVTANAAWFLHQRKGIVKLDLNTHKTDYFPWNSFQNIPPILKTDFDLPFLEDFERGILPSFEWQLIDMNDDEILLFLGMQNGFFSIKSTTLEMFPLTTLNRHFIKGKDGGNLNLNRKLPEGEGYVGDLVTVYFAHDYEKNLLIVSSYYNPWYSTTYRDSLEAIVIDSNGQWFDYTNFILEMHDVATFNFFWPGSFFSSDFQHQLGTTTLVDGMLMADLQPELSIATIPTKRSYEFSGIISMDTSSLLVNSNKQVMRLTDWLNPSATVLDRMTKWWHFVARKGSSIVNSDDKIWFSSLFYLGERTGLQWYQPTTNETDYIPTDVKFEKFSFINNNDVALFEDNWDIDEVGNLYIFNLKSMTSHQFIYKNTPFSIGAKVNDLYLDGNGLLWVGAQNGFWKIDFSTNEVYHFNQQEALKNKNVLCIHKEENGTFWLGTSNSGILIYNNKTGHVRQITESEGLSNNKVFGILKDKASNHWVSTFNGITALDSTGTVLFQLKESDGLISNWFNEQSYFKADNGKLVFGGIGGLSILDPDQILELTSQKQPLKIYLTSLVYFDGQNNKDLLALGSDNSSEPIHILPDKRYIKLDFAISDYVGISEHAYGYRLLPDGYSDEDASSIPWINLGAESQVTINNLPAGDFIIQVRGTDEHSNHVVLPLEIPIHVKEIFYRTWWYYTLVILVFVLGSLFWIRRLLTEKKRLELEVEKRTLKIQKDKATIELQAEKLMELDLAKSRFFTNISHEFRTPLTVILGMTERIKEQPRIKNLILRNAQILLRLINQILELRKLETVDSKVQFIQGDVVAFIHNIIESFHSLAEDKGVLLKFESNHEELMMDYDSEKLLHIISNLLTNAVKFTPDGGEVKIKVEAPKDKNTPFYQILISDTGIGIPEEKILHIFDRFYQVDDELSRTGSGTGIGLALVQELVKLLGGEINVESKLNVGTTFNVLLPYTQNAKFSGDTLKLNALLKESDEEVSNVILVEKSNSKELPTLLIVEDNRDVAEYISNCLMDNYRLLYASDGQEGIDIAIKQVPDIILSDVMMPKVNGYTLCNTLKTDIKTSHIPIVLLTAKADIDSRIIGLQRGADAYLAKPFNEKELKVQLQNLLQLRLKLQQRYINTENLEPSEDPSIQLEDQFVRRVREIILEYMNQDNFGVPELCKLVFMSRTQLHNKLKSLTDKSTSHFIRLIRLEKACQLLRESDLNISQVSMEVGIDSLPYFSRIFTEHTGFSPNKYREKHHKKQ